MDNTENKPTKFRLVAIVGDKLKTNFMQAADVFEQGKVLGEPVEFSYGALNFTKEEAIAQLRDVLSEKFIVSFISAEDDKVLPYVNTDVRVVSNGNKWGILADWIRKEYPHLEVITDEYKFIKEVKLK